MQAHQLFKSRNSVASRNLVWQRSSSTVHSSNCKAMTQPAEIRISAGLIRELKLILVLKICWKIRLASILKQRYWISWRAWFLIIYTKSQLWWLNVHSAVTKLYTQRAHMHVAHTHFDVNQMIWISMFSDVRVCRLCVCSSTYQNMHSTHKQLNRQRIAAQHRAEEIH